MKLTLSFMFIFQSRTFYDDLNAIVKQLGKMETFLATTKQVGLLPETLRTQQRQFMVSPLPMKSVFFCFNCNKMTFLHSENVNVVLSVV